MKDQTNSFQINPVKDYFIQVLNSAKHFLIARFNFNNTRNYSFFITLVDREIIWFAFFNMVTTCIFFLIKEKKRKKIWLGKAVQRKISKLLRIYFDTCKISIYI